MRIVIDGRMILPEMSGVGRYIMGLCRALALIESDISYELLLQDSLPADHPAHRLAGKRFEVATLNVRHMSINGQIAVPKYLKRSKPDLFHYPHFDLPLNTPGKVVLTIHDLKYILHPEFFPRQRAMKRIALHFLMQRACQHSHKIICDSQSTRTDLESRLNIPGSKIHVVPLGVHQDFFIKRPSEMIEEFRREHSLPNPFILFVGERRPHKNLPGLIHAFDIFNQNANRKYELVIAGKPYSDYSIPEQTVSQLEITPFVRFLDYVAEDTLPLLYQTAEALVMLSWYEGFGLPVLEAMASGTPVIASDCTSLPEVVGHAGLLVQPNDPEHAAQAIASVVIGGETRLDCIERGLKRARNFTWDRCARQTEDVYRQVLDK